MWAFRIGVNSEFHVCQFCSTYGDGGDSSTHFGKCWALQQRKMEVHNELLCSHFVSCAVS